MVKVGHINTALYNRRFRGLIYDIICVLQTMFSLEDCLIRGKCAGSGAFCIGEHYIDV